MKPRSRLILSRNKRGALKSKDFRWSRTKMECIEYSFFEIKNREKVGVWFEDYKVSKVIIFCIYDRLFIKKDWLEDNIGLKQIG